MRGTSSPADRNRADASLHLCWGMRFGLLLLVVPGLLQAQTVPFRPGMVVTRSVTITPGRYLAPAGDSAALTIRGQGVVVDLRGVELVGSEDREHPDRFTGTAIRIDGGSDITVRGVSAHGYRVGLIARGVKNLRLLDNDFSWNWKPRLYSVIEKESLIDWLDYHQNEKDEWLRYGAGIYLTDIDGGEIRGNRVLQGMDGLMMTRSDNLKVWNNDFSYNSGLGVGMYRSSHNTIMHNRINFDVRGYSHGFFNRGQDSAGLLMYEQSCNNVVAYNSVTHGGDGLFIWAGQTTMDNGQGGVNDNLFYRNDFSFAPTNGMEATFSRNVFAENRVEGNWHGLWGGYSFSSVVINNRFANNVEAIAIEHGQDDRITGNTFDGDTTAIHLWWNKVEPSDWGYPEVPRHPLARLRHPRQHLPSHPSRAADRQHAALADRRQRLRRRRFRRRASPATRRARCLSGRKPGRPTRGPDPGAVPRGATAGRDAGADARRPAHEPLGDHRR